MYGVSWYEAAAYAEFAGKQLPTVILGDAQGTKYRYARRAGEKQSYLLDHDPNFPRSTGQWLAPTIMGFFFLVFGF